MGCGTSSNAQQQQPSPHLRDSEDDFFERDDREVEVHKSSPGSMADLHAAVSPLSPGLQRGLRDILPPSLPLTEENIALAQRREHGHASSPVKAAPNDEEAATEELRRAYRRLIRRIRAWVQEVEPVPFTPSSALDV